MKKRILDLLLSTIGLIAASPLLIISGLLIKFDSKGPIMFKQIRIGLNGKPFEIYKLRTMEFGAESNGPPITNSSDARVTKIGNFLRKLKLDELPQFINILKGDMSFVGPRPETWAYRDLFHGRYEEILSYIPGIFGPNQIMFRNESDIFPLNEDPKLFYRRVLFPQKAEQDLAYFRQACFLKDIVWIVKGIGVSLFGWKTKNSFKSLKQISNS